jgi:hypothetical protein
MWFVIALNDEDLSSWIINTPLLFNTPNNPIEPQIELLPLLPEERNFLAIVNKGIAILNVRNQSISYTKTILH